MDRAKVESFLEAFVGFTSGATTLGLLAVADRSGLSAYLGEFPTGTVEQIAEGAELEPRYVEEILSGLAAAGVVEYRTETKTFTLPPEHALFISSELSPYFVGGWLDMVPSVMAQIDGVARATVHGGGVGFEEFGNIVGGIDRGNGPSQRVFLVSRWLAAVPGLIDRLEEGIEVADVGCGAGTAALVMATAFPKSHVTGFDVSGDSIAVARARAETIENLGFEDYGAEEFPTNPGFDLITAFDVIHDLVDPLAGLRNIRKALNPDGWFLMMEPNISSDLGDNLSPRGALLYGISALHCMTQSLARDGAGLGAAWGRQRAEELAREAGFTSFELLEKPTNSFSAFYLLTG